MFTKFHDRRIPKVRVDVGVGLMEFQLIYDAAYVRRCLHAKHEAQRMTRCRDMRAVFRALPIVVGVRGWYHSIRRMRFPISVLY